MSFESFFSTNKAAIFLNIILLFFASYVAIRNVKQGQFNRSFNRTLSESSLNRPLLFIKTHKTASSATMNMLIRFGLKRNLIFLLPTEPSHDRMKNLKILPSIKIDGTFDLLCHHSRFIPEISQLLPNSFKFTTLRNPQDQFLSVYKFFNLETRYGANLTGFLENPRKFYQLDDHFGRNPMLNDIGMDNRLFDDLALIKNVH